MIKQWIVLLLFASCVGNSEVKLKEEFAHVDSLAISNANNNVTVIDTLAKYSYLLKMFSNGKLRSNGTGFFIKKNKRLFLVSNYHIFTSQNTTEKKPLPIEFDSLVLVYKRYPDVKDVYTIDLRKIRQESKSYFFFEYPDIYVYELTSLLHPQAIIYSIENMIKPIPEKNVSPIDVFAIGYGGKFALYQEEIFHFTLSTSIYDSVKLAYGPNHLNAIVTNTYWASPKAEGGMSGSPVFFKYSTPNGTASIEYITFGGVISSDFKISNKEAIVKPDEVTKIINKKLKP